MAGAGIGGSGNRRERESAGAGIGNNGNWWVSKVLQKTEVTLFLMVCRSHFSTVLLIRESPNSRGIFR